jgi:hypothetical protein
MYIAPPAKADFGFYNNYISISPDTDLVTALTGNSQELRKLIFTLSDMQLSYRYEPGKWSIKETLVHLIDAERNFCYRVMRLSRGDQAALPMYDIHQFVINAHAADRDINNIIEELELLRKATIAMFQGMHPSMLDKTGPARDVIISVRALGFAMVGHVIHHMNIINEKYLPAFTRSQQNDILFL